MEITDITMIITYLVTFLLGIIAKKVKFVNNNVIPLQNLCVGIIVAVIEWIITKDFNSSIIAAGLITGGAYDIIHNLKKIDIIHNFIEKFLKNQKD